MEGYYCPNYEFHQQVQNKILRKKLQSKLKLHQLIHCMKKTDRYYQNILGKTYLNEISILFFLALLHFNNFIVDNNIQLKSQCSKKKILSPIKNQQQIFLLSAQVKNCFNNTFHSILNLIRLPSFSIFLHPLKQKFCLPFLIQKSGFGKGKQNVIDESYRLAFQYLPNQLGLPSILLEYIYQEVTVLISNQLGKGRGVNAELIKLNIYPKGGLFKQHIDSPKKDALVVFLPCKYEGGVLIVKHNKQKASFNFDYPSTYTSPSFRNSPNLIMLLFLNYLIFRKGIVYGYHCQHLYTVNAMNNINKNPLQRLKGADFQIYRRILQKKYKMKLIVYLKNKYQEEYDEYDDYYPDECQPYEFKYLGRPEKIIRKIFCKDYKLIDFLQDFDNKTELDDVQWLNGQIDDSKYYFYFEEYTGNQFQEFENYCMLAILIYV